MGAKSHCNFLAAATVTALVAYHLSNGVDISAVQAKLESESHYRAIKDADADSIVKMVWNGVRKKDWPDDYPLYGIQYY